MNEDEYTDECEDGDEDDEECENEGEDECAVDIKWNNITFDAKLKRFID